MIRFNRTLCHQEAKVDKYYISMNLEEFMQEVEVPSAVPRLQDCPQYVEFQDLTTNFHRYQDIDRRFGLHRHRKSLRTRWTQQPRQIPQSIQHTEVIVQLPVNSQGQPQSTLCSICSQMVGADIFEPFCCEQHRFCKRCILAVIHQGLNSFKIIKCPESECLAEFNQQSPFYYNLADFHRKRLAKIRNNREALTKPNIKLCRREECDGLLQVPQLKCSLCQQKHCARCFQLQHEGKCDRQVKRGLNRKYRFNRCPNCRMMVQRHSGCNHISCLCGCEFCYLCGDIFVSSHVCKSNAQGLLERVRSNVNSENHEVNSYINCLKILECFEADVFRSGTFKHLQLFLAILIYPFVNIALIALAVTGLALYLLVATVVVILFYISLGLLQVVHLQFAPSAFLLQLGLPKWLIRILAVPMFPLNVVYAVRAKCSLVFGTRRVFEILGTLLQPLVFFLVLPCLVAKQQQEDELE